MNDNFNHMIKETGKSIYKISQESGIPYTTLNELVNEKKNINYTSAETVYKLCLYLKCDMSEMMSFFLRMEKETILGIIINGKRQIKESNCI
jgi:DNA-binding Xre family transcriptional regulator